MICGRKVHNTFRLSLTLSFMIFDLLCSLEPAPSYYLSSPANSSAYFWVGTHQYSGYLIKETIIELAAVYLLSTIN